MIVPHYRLRPMPMPSDPGPIPREFHVTGYVSTWDPVSRVLQIVGKRFHVVPEVSVHGVEYGTRLTVIGYEDPWLLRSIVTSLTVHR